MQLDAGKPLFQHIITHKSFGDNVDEITFPAPVCLTALSVGAVPGAANLLQRPTINVFARDLRTLGSARLACLYEGLNQPASGIASAHLQGFITDHVVLRGTYQTVPISIFGIGLDQAAEAYVPRPAAAPLPLEAAVQRFPKLMARIHDPIKEPKHGGEGREIPGSGPSDGIRYDRDARPTLKALARAAPPSSSKGTLRTRIAAFSSLEPQVAAVEKAADAICAKLAAGEGVLDSGTSSRVDDHLIDLILEWCSLLADTGSPISAAPSVLQCGALGLAAAVLLCTHRPSALSFLQRHGTLLLADVLRMPKAPGSFLRHATAACLLLAHNCGALGCEALLGWWRPAFVQWRTVKKVDRPAAGESAREGGKAKRSARERSPSTAGKDAIIPQVDGAHDDADNGDGGKRKKSKRGGKRKHKEIVWENPADLLPPDAIPAGADADDRWGMDVPEALEDTDALRGDRYDHGHGGSSRRDREKSSKDGRRKRDNEGAREKERRRRERSRSRSPARGHRDGENKERRREKERERSRERRKKEERDRGVAAREAAGEKSSKRHRTPTPPPALPVPTPQEESEDAFHKHLSTKYWDARLKEYAGIYSALSAVLIELCPRPLASIGSCLLRVLRFYERAANFSVTVEEIVRRQGGGGKGKMLPREATEAVSACAEGLAAMAEMLAAGPMPSLLGKKATTPGLLPVPHEPHPLLLELLEARSVLLHLPAVLLVPGTYATESDPQAAAAAAAMLNQLALGCKPFIAVLTSSLAGLKALAAAPDAFEQLALALQDASADSPAFLQSAAAVSNTALAALALEDFCSAAVDSQQFAAAVSSLQKLLTSGHESTQCLLFVAALQSWEVLPRCLHLIQAQAWLQKEAAGLKTTVNGKLCTFEALLDAAPLLSIGADLLSALTGEWHASIVARWAPAAADLVAPLAAEVHALYSCGTPEATALCSKLGHIHGCLEALAAYALEGIAGALPLLDEVLPMLDVDSISTGKWQSSTGASGVAWPAVREFWDDPSRRGKAMAGLRLMCTGLWQPDGRAAAVAIDHAGGLQLLHRAVATAAEAVAAAQTDRQWVSRAGAAIEPAASYVGKRLAVEFLEAAAAAASGLMQHLRSMVSVANEPLAMALVESHAVLSVDEECLLHSMGVEAGADAAVQPPSPALAARCHLTSALRCWIEASDWSPPLLKLVLQGPQRAKQQKNGVKAVAPRQLFTATCLLGDLMPEEWPLPGRRSDQPPPSARKYRLALATAIEGCTASVEQLLSSCIASEPVLLRAAAVRLLSRAAGLGGGMGPFIVAPLQLALEAVGTSTVPSHDAKKLLEVVVPLVYRPALKSALLDAGTSATLASILRIMATGMLPGVPTPVTMDPGEASSVATMVLETLNVLCNPDICLDPTAPIERREIQEVPQTLQATVVASTLLELFPMLGANASLAHRVLRLMVTTLSGRYALRAAVAALHAKANGAPPPPPEPSLHAIVSAAEWVATRFWDSASRARAAGMGDDVANAYADVSEIMKEVCAAIDGDRDRPPPPPPAAIRFAEAAKAAVDAAVQVGLDPNKSEIRWESPDEGAAKAPQELFDPGTRMFWKNFAARAVPQLQAATTPAMKRYTRHTCAPDPELNVAATLHPPLAHPLRPMDEDMEAEGGESDGEAQPPPVELNPEGGTATEEAVLKATVKGEEAHDLGAGVEGSVQKPVEVAANGAGEAEEKNVAAVEPALPAAQPLPAAVVPAGATSVAPLAADLDLYADLDPTMALQAPAPAAVKTEAPPVPDAVQPAAAPPEQEEAPGASMPEEETQEPRELVAVKAEIPPAAEAVREEDVSEDAAAQEGAKAAEEPAAAASSVQHDTGNVKTEKDAPKDAEDYAAPAQDGPPAAAVGDEGPKSGAGEDGAAPKGEEVEGDLDPAALLANPEMVASLLKDPEKLKKLLAKNPALLAALKAKMS